MGKTTNHTTVTRGESARDEVRDPYDPLRLMSPEETADLVGVTERALRNWRHRGGGPAYVKIDGFLIRYRRSDVETWLLASRVQPTAATGGR